MALDEASADMVRSAVRSIFDAEPDPLASLGDFGVGQLLADEPRLAVSVVFAEQGRRAMPLPTLDVALWAQVDPSGSAGADRVVLYPPPGAPVAGRRGADGSVTVDALALGPPRRGAVALVPVAEDDDVALLSAPVAGLAVTPVAGWEEGSGAVRVTGLVGAGSLEPSSGSWDDALGLARRALAHEINGVARGMLDAATVHVTERNQFGRPIGSFQAVRHRLAEAHAWLGGSEAVAEDAWLVGTGPAATLAKAVAGRVLARVVDHALQVSGAMGLTWDGPLQRHVRRGWSLDGFLGATPRLVAEVGARCLDPAGAGVADLTVAPASAFTTF